MDLHLMPDRPTAFEKDAVDGQLGPVDPGRAAPRHTLLPVLHAIQSQVGYLSPGALNYVSQRLDVAPAEIHGVASFYGRFSLTPRPGVVARVCEDIACLTRGAGRLCAGLSARPLPQTWEPLYSLWSARFVSSAIDTNRALQSE